MGILSALFSGGVSGPIEALGKAADSLFTSDEERLQAQKEIEEIAQRPYLKQILVNLTEASHRSIFVAGWRPAVGWVCALSLATYYLPKNIMAAAVWIVQCYQVLSYALTHDAILDLVLPAYPITLENTLLELLLGMLGIAGLRTLEKFGGKAR